MTDTTTPLFELLAAVRNLIEKPLTTTASDLHLRDDVVRTLAVYDHLAYEAPPAELPKPADPALTTVTISIDTLDALADLLKVTRDFVRSDAEPVGVPYLRNALRRLEKVDRRHLRDGEGASLL